MKRRLPLLLAALLISTGMAYAQGECPAPSDFPNPSLLASMQRGVNLPGWDHQDAAQRPTSGQLRAAREAGLTHIRLPIDARPLEGTDAASYLDLLYEEVVLLRSLDFVVSLDLHAGGEIGRRFGTDVRGAVDHLRPMWEMIAGVAARFEPAHVAVELLNEPEFAQDDWLEIARALHASVRVLLPKHTIVLGPSGPQRHETLADMSPLDDRNAVYAVHYYDPFAFTHQGANWGATDDPLRQLSALPFPATLDTPAIGQALSRLDGEGDMRAADLVRRSLEQPWDEAMIARAYDTMAEWARRHEAPVIVNEFGVLSFTAPRQSRLNWLHATAMAAETRCIGWTHWDFQDGFGLIDPETGLPDREIMDALVPAQAGR